MQAIDKFYAGITPNQWLPWIPQLLTCLARKEGQHILNLLCSVGKAFPQAVYFPIRTLYLTIKMEQKEKGMLKCVCGREEEVYCKSEREKNDTQRRERERERERDVDAGIKKVVSHSISVKADQQSKVSTSQSTSEPMDITTPGDITKVLVSPIFNCIT